MHVLKQEGGQGIKGCGSFGVVSCPTTSRLKHLEADVIIQCGRLRQTQRDQLNYLQFLDANESMVVVP